MDDSQSSDVFSDSENYSCRSAAGAMDTVSYESLISNTKTSLTKIFKQDVENSTFSEFFASILHDCQACICQSLDLVISQLCNAKVHFTELCEYLNNAVDILQMLCSFVTAVIESMSTNCARMRTFPTITGRIILTVFEHCKESKFTYGKDLKSVEKQLKDLFRNCHNLQLIYLMVLEKQFMFDLAEPDDLDVLVDVLEINLEIGKVVHTLDVKAMAEQWKAYTMICEKYSQSLMDKNVYENCSKVLCFIIEYNIRTAIEANEEENIFLRSMKVAGFTLKIFLRVFKIFKHSTEKNYQQVLQLLIYIYSNDASYLETVAERPAQLTNYVNSYTLNPADTLLKELLMDENFVLSIHKLDVDDIVCESVSKDENVLGYIILILSATKLVLQGIKSETVTKTIIDSIFRLLPHGHIWFNLNLKFKNNDETVTFGLFEHLLSHTFALATTMNSEEITHLEQKMYESVLGTDCYSALFSSNLWELIGRSSPKQFVLSQIIYLCQMYQKLEKHKMFPNSPQQVHLGVIMSRLFKILHPEDKNKVYNNFDANDDVNASLWTELRGMKLSETSTIAHTERQIIEKLKLKFHKVLDATNENPDEINSLIKLMTLSSTSTFAEQDQVLEDYVIKAWGKACPENNRLLIRTLDEGSLWYLQYIEALASLTTAMSFIFLKTANVVKVLHVVSGIIENGNAELKSCLINLLFTTSQYSIEDENEHLADELHNRIFKCLLQDADNIIKCKFYNEIRKRRKNKNVLKIIEKVVDENDFLHQFWDNFTKHGTLKSEVNLKDQLTAAKSLKYNHRCLGNETIVLIDSGSLKTNSGASNNFDFADIDTLFEAGSDSEPACKKVKLDTYEPEEILTRIEKDVELLCDVKENVFSSDSKVRIRQVCEKLINIID